MSNIKAKYRKLIQRLAKDDAPSIDELTNLANEKKKKGAPKPPPTPAPEAKPEAKKPPPIPEAAKKPRNLNDVKNISLFEGLSQENVILRAIQADNKFPLVPAEYIIWRMIPTEKFFGGLAVAPHNKEGKYWRDLHTPTGTYVPEVKNIRMKKFKNAWNKLPDSVQYQSVKKIIVNNAKTFQKSKEILKNYINSNLGDALNVESAFVIMDKNPTKYGKLSAALKLMNTPEFIANKLLPGISKKKDIPKSIDELITANSDVAEQYEALKKANPVYAEAVMNNLINETTKQLQNKENVDAPEELPPPPSNKSETDRILEESKTPAPKSKPELPLAARPFSDFEAEFSAIVTRKKAKLKDIDTIVNNILNVKDEYRQLNPRTAEMLRRKLTDHLKKVYITKHAWNVMSSNNPNVKVDVDERINLSNTQGQQQALSMVTGPMTPNQQAITGESVIKVLGNSAAIKNAIKDAINQQDQNNQDAVADALNPSTSFCSAFQNVMTDPHPDLSRVAVNVDPSILSNLASIPQPATVNPNTLLLPRNEPPDPGAIAIPANQLPQMVGNPMALLSMPPQGMQGMMQMMALNQAMGSVNRQQAYQNNLASMTQQIDAFKTMMETLKATVAPIWGDEITRRFEHEAYNTFLNKFMEMFMMQAISNQFGIPMENMSIFTQQQMAQMQNPQDGAAFVENPQGVSKVAKNLNPMQKFAVSLVKELTTPTKASIVGLAQIVVTTAK